MLYKILEDPRVYMAFQKAVAASGVDVINNWIRDADTGKEGRHILDVGCGSVDNANLIPGKYVGVDINPKYIDFCKQRFKGHYLTMDATQLDFADASFDVVFNIGLCHHIDDHQVKKGVEEWLRVLKPGGRLILVDAIMPLQRWNLPGWILRKLDRGAYVRSWDVWSELFSGILPPDSKLTTFSSFPYDFSGAISEKPLQ